jgi:magnesium chelatase family protein
METNHRSEDFRDVRGQFHAKRAIEVAMAGGHNMLMIGPPGSGKTMLAKRIPSILPPMSFEEGLETTRIHSVTGLLPSETGIIDTRPFRSPHHTISDAGLVGGGSVPRPGEVSMAHNGVLFLDELPEFPKPALEALRQPMEAGRTTVARAAAHITYPSRFQLIAAMNPCRCGYLGDAARECGQAPRCGENYQNRISGPLLDRIDLTVEVQPATAAELSRAPPGEASAVVAARVARARAAQRARFGPEGAASNAEADAMTLEMQAEARALLERAAEQLRLSPRGYSRTLRVARSIADLGGAPVIRRQDVAEALAFRHRGPRRKG